MAEKADLTIQDIFDAHTLALSAIGNGIKLGNDPTVELGYDLLKDTIAAAKRLVNGWEPAEFVPETDEEIVATWNPTGFIS